MRLLFTIFTLIAVLSSTSTARAEALNICYDQWPPMTIFPTKEDPRRGIVIDIMHDMYRAEGYDIHYLEVPYGRGMQMVADGKCDLLPEKEFSVYNGDGFVYAEQATFKYPTAFVVRKGDPWRYDGVASLKGHRVATGLGWNYSSMSMAYQAYLEDPAHKDGVEVVAGDDDVVQRVMRMIMDKRIDLYADNIFVLKYVRAKAGLQDHVDIVQPGLEKVMIQKPIFSLKISEEKRQRLMSIWDKGRLALSDEAIATYIQPYGISSLK